MPSKFKEIEEKWVKYWYDHNLYEAVDTSEYKQKKYILVEFPFPSGASLHVGHCFRYTVPDIYSRFLRMQGYNVLFPIGWDAFGLPTEEFAKKVGKSPAQVTKENITALKNDILKMGYGVDWNREINTTDPNYYKWTQWIFAQMYKAGLATQEEVDLWWCEELKTVLANEEILEDEKGNKISERGGYPVVRKKMKQWVLRITKYAEKLLSGLETVDFPENIKEMQRNWIGKSQGVEVDWEIVEE